MDNYETTGFIIVEKNRTPIYGLNLNYVNRLNDEIDFIIFGEGTYKKESDSFVFDSQGNTMENNNESLKSYVLGGRLNIQFPYFRKFDSLIIIFECYYNDENWNNSNFKNFLKQDQEFLAKNIDQYKIFKNSKYYLFGSLIFFNAFIEDLKLISSFISNVDDNSYVIIPKIEYNFSDDLLFGIRGLFLYGEPYTEFGSAFLSNEVSSYIKFNF